MIQRVLVSLVCFLVMAGGAVATDGNKLLGLGAIQKGTAGAGVAAPQDSTWVMLNPAAMVELGARIDQSVDFAHISVGARPRGLLANPFAGHLRDTGWIPIPQLGLTTAFPLGPGVFGMGLFSIAGNDVDFDKPRTWIGLFRNSDRRGKTQVVHIPISYGYQFDNGWAIGASLIGSLHLLSTDGLTPRLIVTRGDAEGDETLGIGFQLALYKRWDRVSIGALYRSRQWTEKFEAYDDLISESLDQPAHVQVGMAVRPFDKLELLFDVRHIWWSEVEPFGRTPVRGGLGWGDETTIKLGAIYRPNERWTARMGYSFGDSPIKDENVFANILSPAISDSHLGVGFSRTIGDHHEVHFAYMHSFAQRRTESGTGDLLSRAGRRSELEFSSNDFTFQYTFKF